MSLRPVVATRESETLSLTEAAQVLGISRDLAYRLANAGEFPVPVLRIGRLMKVSRIQLDRLLAGEPLVPTSASALPAQAQPLPRVGRALGGAGSTRNEPSEVPPTRRSDGPHTAAPAPHRSTRKAPSAGVGAPMAEGASN